ncbi:cation:proton antiporter [Fulvivirga sp. 29W222]|uniref:Cation:proton antiporter n=1 Tax=Fulvivirga marina TaxID=2494733 RepID=A0A937KFB3_9BACT|nr:cation:proton antiporter [Fulvivirga marina]MBL6448070.1 cation:proton antiporter [Fulvivirga marina]
MSIYIFLSICFLLIFLLAPLVEKARVPWIFAALLVGIALAIYDPNPTVKTNPAFLMLSELGMYFLLFIIGLEIDLSEVKKLGKLIFKTTFVTITLATLFGSTFIHFTFGTPWLPSILVAMSFGTVGEAILVPILDEFNVIHTQLGQTIIGVATLDDIVELVALIWLSVLLGIEGDIHTSIGQEVIAFVLLIVLTIVLFAIKRFIPKIKIPDYPGIILCFMLILFFTYVGIGELAGMEALAAILAGVSIKHFVTPEQLELLKTHTKLLTYGFLAPIFFLQIGMEINIHYLITNFWLVILITLISKLAKLLGSWWSARKELGVKKSLLMGIALSVRFSTSIVIITVLYQNHLIGDYLFSILIASSILFKFIVPPLFANLLAKWNVALKPE